MNDIFSYDYLATQKRCLIVPSCGFDSIPSDITVYYANKTLKSLAGPETEIDMSTSAFNFEAVLSPGTLKGLVSYFRDVPAYLRVRSRQQFYLSNGE